MGGVFGSEKPLKEVVRENQRMLKKAIRDLEKEIRQMETNEKKLVADIRKAAKQNQMSSVKIMVKDLVRSRQYITKFIEMKAHLTGISLKLQTVASHEAMNSALKGAVGAMKGLNKQINSVGLQKILTEFMKENERSELTQEMMGDSIDDALSDENTAEEEDSVLMSVLAELGVGTELPDAPSANPTEAASQKTLLTQKNDKP